MSIGDVETGRCLHINFFLEVSIEISGFDIHLVDFKVVLGCKCEYSMEGGEFGNWGKSLVEVNALNLSEALCNDPSFILLNAFIWATLDMENPFASNNLPSFWLRNDVIDFQVLPSVHLIFASCEPLGSIRTGHGFVVCLRFRDLSIGGVGAVVVG